LAITVGKESFSPEELVAMVLNHAKEITHAYGEEKGNVYGTIKDCVLTVPSFATQAERLSYLDAAKLADLNVLSLIDENTAAALHFGMDKMYEEPRTVLFYNLGGGSLQVSIVKFHTYEIPESKNSKKTKTVGSIEVLAKTWDATLGGEAFDNKLVEYLADHFNREWRHARGHDKDVRSIPSSMSKLRLQANKVKQVLSANNEIPIHIDNLYDDMTLSVSMTRTQLEDLCSDLMERAVVPVLEALKIANLTLAELTEIEMIGGGMRVPKVQAELSKALGDKELGMHINSDESMALGAAFFGANISTAFRVRHVGLTDINPFPVGISLEELAVEEKKGLFGGSKKKEEEDEEVWSKKATMFKSLAKLGVKKTIAFSHDKDIHCALDYEESEQFPQGAS
jgi:hypoxia up-regulated 1